MKILVDMNLSPLWIPFLQQHGYDVVHWSDVGPPSASDSQIMEYAATSGSVILTHDLDFGTLLALRRTRSPSVVQIRTQDVMPLASGEIVANALKVAGSYLAAGALVTIDPMKSRIRVLPI